MVFKGGREDKMGRVSLAVASAIIVITCIVLFYGVLDAANTSTWTSTAVFMAVIPIAVIAAAVALILGIKVK